MQTYESPYEWPRFEDGELVRIGDEVEYQDGVRKVGEIAANRNGWVMLLEPQGIVFAGERVRRPFRDTQEAIDADATMPPRAYAERLFGERMRPPACDEDGATLTEAMILDLLRRQRELDAREAAKGGER